MRKAKSAPYSVFIEGLSVREAVVRLYALYRTFRAWLEMENCCVSCWLADSAGMTVGVNGGMAGRLFSVLDSGDRYQSSPKRLSK